MLLGGGGDVRSLDGNPRGVCGRRGPEMLEVHQAPVNTSGSNQLHSNTSRILAFIEVVNEPIKPVWLVDDSL